MFHVLTTYTHMYYIMLETDYTYTLLYDTRLAGLFL